MLILTKKLHNNFSMPVFGFGTWGIGGFRERDLQNNDERDIAAIKMAIYSGITHIDTAEIYANNYSEILTGKAIQPFNRKDLFLVSKAKADNLNYEGIKAAVLGSLTRLGVSYLDLYLMHRYPPRDNLKECIQAMNELVEEGLIRNIGISNFNVEHTKQAQELSKNPIVATQVHYNLLVREAEGSGLLEYCQKNDIMVIAWRPLQKGIIVNEENTIIDMLCKKYKKTAAQIAINWLIMQPNVVTLSKSSTLEHLQENLGALDWEMEPKDVERLRNEFPNQQNISDAVPLG